MAGHSKWANIRHRKGAQDAKRGKIFTKLIREITVAARQGGGDIESNPRLRDALTKALKSNMKKETVENAIKRGVGGLDGSEMMEMSYEGYGPEGVAVLVNCLSDNRNRTVSEIRHAFSKHGGNLGTDGSVAYLFNSLGQLSFSLETNQEALIEAAIEIGAEDVLIEEESVEVITTIETYHEIYNQLKEKGFEPLSAELTMKASVEVPLEKEGAEKLMRLIDALEDLDDVQQVYSNANISEQILTEL